MAVKTEPSSPKLSVGSEVYAVVDSESAHATSHVVAVVHAAAVAHESVSAIVAVLAASHAIAIVHADAFADESIVAKSVPSGEPALNVAVVLEVAPAAVDNRDSIGTRHSISKLHCLRAYLVILAHTPTQGHN